MPRTGASNLCPNDAGKLTTKSPNSCPFGLFALGSQIGLLPCRRHIRAAAMRNLRGHANALAQRGVRVDRLADLHCVCSHLDGQSDLVDQVTALKKRTTIYADNLTAEWAQYY